jgi:hypothetical protein
MRDKELRGRRAVRRFRRCGPFLLVWAIFTFARSVDVPRRTRRSASTVGGAAPDVTIGGACGGSRGSASLPANQPHARPRRYAVTPKEMLAELCADNRHLTRSLRSTHEVCDRHNDVATASLIENWIDETERRTWFLSEIERDV